MKKLLITALLAAATSALAAGAPAGSTISNTGLFEYTDVNGQTASESTTPVNVTVSQVYDPNVSPNGTVAQPGQTVTAGPGATATLTYTVTNNSNGTDTLNLTVIDPVTGSPLTATIYLDDGDGVFGPGDTVVTSLPNLDADESQTVFVRYTVPSNASGNQITYVDLVATSAGDTGQKDQGNVGAITVNSILSFTLEGDNTINATPNAAVTVTHTLTNTGNTPIVAANLVATTTLNTPSVGVTYTVVNNGTGTSVSNTDLQAALRAAGDLAAGQTYTITVTYTPAVGTTNGQGFTNTLTVYSNVADSSTYDNRVEQGQAVSDTDTITVQRGIASVSKVVENCSTDASCAAPTLNASTAKPGDYLRYTVTVTNTGSAALRFPTLRDYVPVNTVFGSVSGSTTQPSADVLFSNTRLAWNNITPTALATTTNPANGPFVYVGLDSDGNGTVDDNDLLQPNQTLRMVLIVKVRDTGTSN
ncbi:hypothetical protein QOL99_02330 [Deinococcus sp. MIMF12]|uniref:DUF11 domain-containing protein n=1 Tax=Deinococcus rhizophilus TaxID=3049544 RepID=A0ABT7JD61_9DEIO|nr:hypothetical protein [Deinococcus rhizophilus]MDL2342981.1 hypothetical protein [Deinococcus rhizophilus]